MCELLRDIAEPATAVHLLHRTELSDVNGSRAHTGRQTLTSEASENIHTAVSHLLQDVAEPTLALHAANLSHLGGSDAAAAETSDIRNLVLSKIGRLIHELSDLLGRHVLTKFHSLCQTEPRKWLRNIPSGLDEISEAARTVLAVMLKLTR